MDIKIVYKSLVMVWMIASLTQTVQAQTANCSITSLRVSGYSQTDIRFDWSIYDAMTGGDPDCVSASMCVNAINVSSSACHNLTGYEGNEDFDDLLPGVMYAATMTTLNTDGGEDTDTVYQQTITRPVSDVVVTGQEMHALHIAIYKPADPCGKIDFYRVYCQSMEPYLPYSGIKYVPGTCDSPDPIHVTLNTLGDGYAEPLRAGTKYYIQARGYSNGDHNGGAVTTGTTLLGEPRLWNVTSTSIEIFWREPVDNYDKVILNCTDLDGSSHGYDEALPGDTTAVCTGLTPGSEYSLTLCTHLDGDPVPPACADPGFPNIITPLNVVKHDD